MWLCPLIVDASELTAPKVSEIVDSTAVSRENGMAPMLRGLQQRSDPYAVIALCTGYGYQDNDPPSAAIAYPGPPPRHQQATQATGTYDDPGTFAADKNVLAPGTMIYVAYLKKYFIMEDYCLQCIDDLLSKGSYHFDLWLGKSSGSQSRQVEEKSRQLLEECASAITKDGAPVIVNPPRDLQVDATLIFDDNKCIIGRDVWAEEPTGR